MALTTLPLRLLKTTRSKTRNSLFFRTIGLGLMFMYLPLLTGCGPGGNSGDGSVIAIPGNGNSYGQSKIRLSPTSLDFSTTEGANNPTPQTVNISNVGAGTFDWTVTTTAAWLSLSPDSGTTPSSFTATVNAAGLAAGTYSGTITVTGVGATNTPQSIPVALTVSAPTLSSSTPTTSLTAVTLTWNPNTDPGVTGYFVHYGTLSPNLSGSCSYAQSTFYPLDSLSSSTSPNVTISGLTEGTIYYFAVSAFNGFESSCSNEVSKTT